MLVHQRVQISIPTSFPQKVQGPETSPPRRLPKQALSWVRLAAEGDLFWSPTAGGARSQFVHHDLPGQFR